MSVETQTQELAKDEIDASPTKQLFIYMLTRDVTVVQAILDLVDNSVDGARRMNANDFSKRWVRIEMDRGKFNIYDNCGGISLDKARSYAFRFGRDDKFPASKDGDLGRFGVGMKRTIFKLGRKFDVKSTHADESFAISENLDTWVTEKRWVFHFTKLEDPSPLKVKEPGTFVGVSRLNPGVGEVLARKGFDNELRQAISKAHRSNLDKGLQVLVNGIPAPQTGFDLASSTKLTPLCVSDKFQSNDGEVEVKVIAGIAPEAEGEKSKSEPGWYVYCNHREVLHADLTPVTGWGTNEGKKVPMFHGQFARFRGAVFFDSEDPLALPWNTSKTALDTDSPVYQSTKVLMVNAMREVIDFLNDLDKEPKGGPLHQAVSSAKPVAIHEVPPHPSFKAPTRTETANPNTIIQYKRPKRLVDRVKEELEASSNQEVGEMTFDYYVDSEGLR